jgi:outer membrane lipoprotein SlyB
MNTQANKFPQSLMWIAGIALTVFCVTGVAAIMGWIPASSGSTLAANNSRATVEKGQANPTESNAPTMVALNSPAKAICKYCGVVESARTITVKGEGSGLGAAGGAVVGGVLGHQIGGGNGKQLATVLGAVGGVVAGNEIEKQAKSTTAYEIGVRMNNGSHRVFREPSASGWRVGDHVKVINGVIRSN